MRESIFAAIMFALVSSPAAAQTVSLKSDETVTLRIGNGDVIVERVSEAKPLTKYEAYVVWRAETQEIPAGAKTMPPTFLFAGEGPPDPPIPVADQLQVTLRRVPGTSGGPGGTALFLANGYGSKVRYHAVMNAGTRSAPTDVCDVLPNRPGLEYWPFTIDRIDLSDLHFELADGAVQCG